MYIAKFGSKFGLSEDEIYDTLLEMGLLKANYSPNKKALKEGLLSEDHQVIDSKTLKSMVEQHLASKNENDEEPLTYDDLLKELEPRCSEAKLVKILQDNNYMDEDENWTNLGLTKLVDVDFCITDTGYDLIMEAIEAYENKPIADEPIDFDTLCQVVENYDFKDKSEITELMRKLLYKLDEIQDTNDLSEYKGWTISTKKGIITAKKGSKVLTTTAKGNIKKVIDRES